MTNADESAEDLIKRALGMLQREAETTKREDALVYVAPDRYVTVKLASKVSGYSETAIRSKIKEGVWLEGREYIRAPDGHLFIDREGVQRWLLSGRK
jgi:hypothetical protein